MALLCLHQGMCLMEWNMLLKTQKVQNGENGENGENKENGELSEQREQSQARLGYAESRERKRQSLKM